MTGEKVFLSSPITGLVTEIVSSYSNFEKD
jgi:hypothetical protein